MPGLRAFSLLGPGIFHDCAGNHLRFIGKATNSGGAVMVPPNWSRHRFSSRFPDGIDREVCQNKEPKRKVTHPWVGINCTEVMEK